jgi:predicted membrane protein
MTISVILQTLGSLCVLIGYYLNSNSNPRQHMAFIGGHIFLLILMFSEEKWILFALSIIIIILQYRISKRKYKFKKDIVRVKKAKEKIIKCKTNENSSVTQSRSNKTARRSRSNVRQHSST